MGQEVGAGRETRDVEFLQWRRLMIRVGPARSESLEVPVALEVGAWLVLLQRTDVIGELDVDEAERDLGAYCDRRAVQAGSNLERRDRRLVPVVVFGMEQ